MAYFTWDPHKNEKLIRERGVSFEVILRSIELDKPLEVIDHPNPKKYPGQRMFVVKAMDYVFLVPFEEIGEEIKLITIIPSRKAYKKYFKGGGGHEG